MRSVSHKSGESGIVLLTTLLILMMVSALMVGFYAAVNSDVRATAIDRDQTQAYAAAHAGLEKLTSDLAQLFEADFSPSSAEILAFNTFPPVISGFEYRAPGGVAGSGYAVSFSKTDVNGNPAPENVNGSNITAGPYKGLKGIITKYPITITARSITGNAEVRLRRELQTVAVPVFQFGVFSETDLTFYAGDNFDFGGRVHTNGNLFLSNLTGKTLTFTDYITAVKEVVRAHFSNGLSVASHSFTGNVVIPTAIGSPGRNLKYTGPNEASVTTMPTYPAAGQTVNTNWFSIAHATYKDIIRNYMNGAKRLDLPLVSQGAAPIDLIRRPPEDEDTDNPLVYAQRFYTQAGLRILLSDRSADITSLPGLTADAPVALDNWLGGPPAGYTIGATRPPIARSPGPLAAAGTLASSSAVSGTSPNVTINLSSSVPAELRIPLLTVGALTNVVCTGKTASSFTGCTLGSNVASAAVITASVTDGTYSWTASTVTTAAVTSGTGRTLTVTANETLDFTPKRTFWVNGTATAPTPPATVLVSCTGYTESGSTHQLAGCSWTGNAAPGNSQTITTNAVVPVNTALIGGFIKIEKQDSDGDWSDVTLEILNLGIAAANQQGAICSDPNPDAVLRIQRLRDNGGGSCDYSQSLNPYDYWPNVLYDTREGNYRNVATSGSGSGMNAGGVMAYVALDVANLKKWLAGTTGTTGNQTWNNNGYIVYFSDRRGDHNEDAAVADSETGEYGFEDVVNPASSTGTPNGTLDSGENVNAANIPANTVLDRYGEDPAACCGVIPAGTASPSPYDANSRPWTPFTAASSGNPGMAFVNKPVLFRRALKLINGGISGSVNNLPTSGLTVVAENPVYVQGNYNATTSNSAEPNVPAAVLADAVSLLSNNWTDAMSFRYPNSATTRNATTTGYRFAVVAGKGLSFSWPSAGSPHFLFGTDGGVGNFLRLLEDWNISGVSINYRGSIVSLFHSRQATGTFKYGTNVYDYGDRNFSFDNDYLMPSLLPPGTPMFRDVNTLTFRQILRPTQ